jgi:outer membrane protein OmpA-like peptidoglycan-associated protein
MRRAFLLAAAGLLALTLAACERSDVKSSETPASSDGAVPEEGRPAAGPRLEPAAELRREPAASDEGSALTGEVSDLEGLISELHGKVTEQEIIIELPTDVLFDFDKSDIRADAVPTLQKLARLIGPASGGVVRVNGHTDAIGDDVYNLELSQRRAAAVTDWLGTRGKVPTTRLRAEGLGESRPVAPNTNDDGSDNPAGRQLNRRVEVIIPRE